MLQSTRRVVVGKSGIGEERAVGGSDYVTGWKVLELVCDTSVIPLFVLAYAIICVLGNDAATFAPHPYRASSLTGLFSVGVKACLLIVIVSEQN